MTTKSSINQFLVRKLIQEIIDQEVSVILEGFNLFSEQDPIPDPPDAAPDAPVADAGADTDMGDLDLGDDSGGDLDLGGDDASGDLGGDGEPGADGGGGEEGMDDMGDLGGGGGMPSFGGGGGGGGGGLDMGGDESGDESGSEDSGDASGDSGPESTGDPVEDTFSAAEEIAKNTQNPQKVLNSIKAAIQDTTISSKQQMKDLVQKMTENENSVLNDAARRLRIFINT